MSSIKKYQESMIEMFKNHQKKWSIVKHADLLLYDLYVIACIN